MKKVKMLRAEQSRAEQSRAEQSRAEQSRLDYCLESNGCQALFESRWQKCH